MITGILLSLLVFACLLTLKYYPRYRRGLLRVSDHPGFRTLISPMSPAGFCAPRIPCIATGFDMPWVGKHKVFADFGSDVITCVSANGRAIVYLADADLIAKVNGDRYSYPKPVSEYTVLNYFGPNLVTAEGFDWRDQHLISAPAFDSQSYIYLWQECCGIIDDMFDNLGWLNKPVGEDIQVNHVVDITLQMALLAIANAGFGMQSKWKEDLSAVNAPGHGLSFMTALHIVAQSSILKLALPAWACKLPVPKFQDMAKGFVELEKYIQEMIAELKLEIARPNHTPRNDLFYGLVRQNMLGDVELSDAQLQGNIYIFLLAGHETTAHSMAFMLACLALWPEVQEKLCQHLVEKIGDEKLTTYDDYKRLDYLQATYFETLRMFPPVQQIPKVLDKDTIFVFDRTNEHNTAIGLEEAARRSARQKEAQRNEAYRRGGNRRDSIDSDSGASASSLSSLLASPSVSSVGSYTSDSDDKDFPPVSPLDVAFPGSFPHADTGDVNGLPPRMVRNPSNCRPVSQRVISPSTTEQTSLFVEKDTIVFVSPPGVHYNPKYYPEPEEFRPERFMGKYDKTAFLPFSSGTRACLGRHFSEVESVAYMAHFLLNFSVHPTPAYPGETVEEMKLRMFNAVPLITLTPSHIPLTFRRRPPVPQPL